MLIDEDPFLLVASITFTTIDLRSILNEKGRKWIKVRNSIVKDSPKSKEPNSKNTLQKMDA
ncbi:conserved hypothetical protein [Ricinus communis]|uniref:Uncharacterized protein n=1 Tax=Ricinus communis TaxID=3988 RepID=B9SZB3_RICCO|nr:conserved hypothetical protein [Ricinus communis]